MTVKELLAAGVHFGHARGNVHPKMFPFIYTTHYPVRADNLTAVYGGVHIIDVRKTLQQLEMASSFLYDAVLRGATILFVGTKQAARESVEKCAQACGAYYVTTKWIGGMLTNFHATTLSSIERMEELKKLVASPIFQHLPLCDRRMSEKRLTELQAIYGGMVGLTSPPDVIYLVDIVHERVALAEANKLGIATVAIVDTNGDPTKVTIPIPANDDSIRAIALITEYLANAIAEARQLVSAEEMVADGSQTE